MKSLMILCLSLVFSPLVQAKDLELVVLKLGDIQSYTLTEASRRLIIVPNEKTATLVNVKWTPVEGGERCTLTKKVGIDDFPDRCGIGTEVEVKMVLNNKYEILRDLNYWVWREPKWRGDSKAKDYISDQDIETVRNVDLSDYSDFLTELYDVNNATPFLENGEYYLKQIRIYFDRIAQKVDHWKIEKVVIPTAK